jgi:hypothetical protein
MIMSTARFKGGQSLVLSYVFPLLAVLLLAPLAFSQTSATGALTGTLKDSSGAVVPNATVTATSIGTGQARTTTTGTDGGYKFGLLPPGDYKLKFEATGFSVLEVPSVTIVVTETSVFDQTLQVGAQTQQVEVRGETEVVQTASSTVGTVVSSQTITDMPLTSRNYTTLLGIAAGANTGVYNAANLGAGSQDIAVNGSGIAQNNFQMDGASIIAYNSNGRPGGNGANPGIGIVNPDAIQEFKIQTSLYDSGYGRNPGANVNVVTKSGTNQFHGSAFEFFRNTALNANDFFRKISPPVGGVPEDGRQVLNQNQYGGTFGGPVKKDKLFFFAAYQETWQKNGFSLLGYSTPTLVGIPQGSRSTPAFQSALGAAFCPGGSAAGTTKATSAVQVACNGSNINPVALNVLNLKNADGSYYIPSSSTGVNQNTTFSVPAHYTEPQAIGNFDYVVNDRNTLSGRWFFSEATTKVTMGCAATATAVTVCLPGGPGNQQFPIQYGVGKLTSILSNNVVNEARFSLQLVAINFQNQIPFTDTQVGIAPVVSTFNVLDTTIVTGLMQWGGFAQLSTNRKDVDWELADQISWSRGKHTIRAGFEYERDLVNWHFPGAALGSITFQTFQDFLLGLPGCAPSVSTAACTASGVAGATDGSFTSNISSSGTTVALTPPGGITHYWRAAAANAFIQDDYKVLSNLMLNLGLRWEYDGLIYDANGQLTNVWPSLINTVPLPGPTPATGTLAGFVVPSNYNPALNPAPPVGGLFQNNKTIPTQNSPSRKDFAPRAGFAWKPLASDRFVVRGGAGYFYDRPPLNNYAQMAQGYPYAQTVSLAGAATYFSTLAQPYAPASLGWSPRWVNINSATQSGTSSNLNAYLLIPNYLTPTTYEWNLNLQYEFAPRWVFELGYVGSRGIHQVFDASSAQLQINEASLASPANPVNGLTTNTVANASLRVPYLGFAPGGLQMSTTTGDRKFNSLQAIVRKQFSHGFQMQAQYTFSRLFDTGIYNGFNDPRYPQYGLDSGYRPQRFTINYSYDLPLGNHDGLLGKITSGWSLAGVTVVQDGQPLTIEDTRGGSIYGFGAGSAIISTAQFLAGMGPANVATPGGVQARLGGATGGPGYFNKAAFGTTPVIGNGTGYGNSGFGILLGPGQFNFDGTIQKTTKVGGIHEDATLVFRTEFFNMFNHPQFANPTGSQTDVSKSTFGQITSSSVNPRLVQFALKYVF